jgi:hypothetical protein
MGAGVVKSGAEEVEEAGEAGEMVVAVVGGVVVVVVGGEGGGLEVGVEVEVELLVGVDTETFPGGCSTEDAASFPESLSVISTIASFKRCASTKSSAATADALAMMSSAILAAIVV